MEFIRGTITEIQPHAVYEDSIFNQFIIVQTEEHKLYLFDSLYEFTQLKVGEVYQFIASPITGRNSFEYSQTPHLSIDDEMWTGQIIAPPRHFEPACCAIASRSLLKGVWLPILTTYGVIVLPLKKVLEGLNTTDIVAGDYITWKSGTLYLYGVIEEPS